MKTRFVEATQAVEGGLNWGKFMVGLFEPDEWARTQALVERMVDHDEGTDTLHLPGQSLLRSRGWTAEHVLVFDLQTGEGSLFRPGGSPSADLDKHKVWVCPMFEPFLAWLYGHVASEVPADDPRRGVVSIHWFDRLPSLVELPDAPFAMQGHRRDGAV